MQADASNPRCDTPGRHHLQFDVIPSPYPPVVAVAVAVGAFADDQDGAVFTPRRLAAATSMEQLSDDKRSSVEPQ
jgi:hypothetical protein